MGKMPNLMQGKCQLSLCPLCEQSFVGNPLAHGMM